MNAVRATLGSVSLMLALATVTAPASAATIITDYSDGGNPALSTREYVWERVKSGSIADPIRNESATPPYLRIADPSTTASLFYRYLPTAQEHEDAWTKGFKLTMLIRVPEVDTTIDDYGASVQYLGANGRQYTLMFGTDEQGQQRVLLQNSSFIYTVTGTTTDDFVLYELIYNPTSQTADLFVNGDPALLGVGSATGNAANQRVLFGAGSSGGTGVGDYGIVRLEIIPEPASLGLLAVGGLLLLRARRCRPIG